MDMKKFLVRLFTWISEHEACEKAMYDALYASRIAPLIEQVLLKNEEITKLKDELADCKAEINSRKANEEVSARPKRKYNKRKKADDKA